MFGNAGRGSGGNRAQRAAGLLAAAVVLCFAAQVRGQTMTQSLSDIPAAFVDVGIGSREMGMGGASVVTTTGASAIFWNPAGLAASDAGTELMVTYGSQMGLVPYSAVAGSKRMGENYVVGIGIVYSGDDALSEMTGLFSAAGEFDALPWVADERLRAGATLRARWASFGNNGASDARVTGSALGAALDLGVVVPVTDRAQIGLSGRDLVGILNWDSSSSGTYEEGVPPALVIGLALELSEGALVEVDLDKALHLDGRDLVSVGGEVTVFDVAALRAGYRKALAPHELEEFSLGGGAVVSAANSEITLDVAYVFGELENTLRLGVGFAF